MQPLEADEPRAIGPYRLLGRLGSGGMGRVYLGRSAGGRTVAVKSVHPHFALDEQFRARFRREVEAARRVGGDWTAPVLDADPGAPVPWVATGYVAGPSLAQAVAPALGTVDATGRPGYAEPVPLPESTVRVLGASLAEALAHVHSLGLVHRDVKPSNVLLTVDGPRLIDFGIARATDGTASLTSTGASIGSPGYMAPEQILGRQVTGAVDVFSLGAVLAFAARGRAPFPGDSSPVLLYKVVHEEPELDALHGELLDVVTGCLAKDPAARPTPRQLAARLAPEGAARAVSAGWLPAPLVAEVGRSAIRLLDLEASEPAEAAGAAPASGAAEAFGGAGDAGGVGASGAGGGFGGGAFGGAERAGHPSGQQPPQAAGQQPPPPPPGHGPQPSQPPGHGRKTPPQSYGTGQEQGPGAGPGLSAPAGVFGPPDPFYAQGAAAADAPPAPGPRPGRGPGKLSVSVAATTTGPSGAAGGRGRKLSCTVALAVAGALAVVTVGSAFVFDLLPGGGSEDQGGAPAGKPPRSTGPGTASPTANGAIPAAYLGTWRGEATASGIPDGTFELVVHQPNAHKEFALLTQTDLLGGTCKDVLTLKKADDDEIVATGKGAASNSSHCSQTAHAIYLRPEDDDLALTSDDPPAGDPKSRMTKVD